MFIEYKFEEGFNPEGGNNYPPVGIYNLFVNGIKPGQTKGGHPNLELTFKVAEGQYAGQEFTQYYNTGHPNDEARRISMETLARIYFAVTGTPPPANGLPLQDAMFKSFQAELVKDGEYYKLKNFKNLEALKAVTAAAPAVAAPASAPWAAK